MLSAAGSADFHEVAPLKILDPSEMEHHTGRSALDEPSKHFVERTRHPHDMAAM